MTRIYIDMVGDLFHYGHVNALKQCKGEGDYLIVGVHNDKTVESYKRTPILNMDERIGVIESCKYVNEIIRDAPLKVSHDYIKTHNIDLVCVPNNRSDDEFNLMYGELEKLGVIKRFNYTETISTTDIINRINRINN